MSFICGFYAVNKRHNVVNEKKVCCRGYYHKVLDMGHGDFQEDIDTCEVCHPEKHLAYLKGLEIEELHTNCATHQISRSKVTSGKFSQDTN